MRLNRAALSLSMLALLAAAGVARASDNLASAYSAILRGEYDNGKTEVSRLLEQGKPDAELQRLGGWLDAYSAMTHTRDELRANSFNWSCEQSQKALAEGKTFLALSFAARATEYAADKAEYAKAAWVTELSEKAMAEAAAVEKAAHWRDALSYYAQLERIHEGDAQLKKLREHAARHARLEMIYADNDAVKRRVKDVDKSLLRSAVSQINKNYYREPDFKEMGRGAIENLEALTETTKLFETFDGLANPDLRNLFLQKLDERKKDVASRAEFDYKDLLKLFNDVAAVNKETVDLPEGLLVVEFFEGAVSKLDEFTSVIWPADSSEFDKMMMGEFRGVGIQLGVDETSSRLKVTTPLEDSPALEAGIEAGDLIIEVDGRTTKGWTTEDAVREITGPAGTPVKLTIFRPSTAERLEFPLTRREIHLRSVRGTDRMPEGKGTGWNYMIDKDQGIAYIRLTGFNVHSTKELEGALEEAKAQGMKALVLDLRFNPGGLLDVAISTVSLFLNKGEVVSTKGRKEARQQFDVDGPAKFAELPLIVLVNDGSASASEILAGALQDHARAIILGERTFGKGSVQRVLPLDKTARLKLTTALYYLPSGRSPHKALNAETWGVDPDWEVKLTPKETRKTIEHENDTRVIRRGEAKKAEIDDETRKKNLEALKSEDKSKDKDEPLLSEADIALLESDPFAARDVDPQLEHALLQLRVKLAADLPWPRKLAARTATVKPTEP